MLIDIRTTSYKEFARLKKEIKSPTGRPKKYHTEEERIKALKEQRVKAQNKFKAKKLSTHNK